VLERHGVTPGLGNARNMKNVPGRRTDWQECQWLQFLHSVGWLRAAFRPDGEVSAVRSLLRHRTDLVQIAAQHIQHMQKSLTQMNLQIHHGSSEITGVTGVAMGDAISGGQRDPAVLAKLRDHGPEAQTHGDLVRGSALALTSSQATMPVKRSFRNRWWATGNESICSL